MDTQGCLMLAVLGILFVLNAVDCKLFSPKHSPRHRRDTTCPYNHYLKKPHCVKHCGSGMYGDMRTHTCQRCSSKCKTCANALRNDACTSCEPNLFLREYRCVAECAPYYKRSSTTKTLRLTAGQTDFEGRVEVFHDGAWGTVCDDKFDINAARVVCRELMLGDAIEVLYNAEFSRTAGSDKPVWLDEVKCTGREARLQNCAHTHWGEHNCAHSEDVGVRCTGPDKSHACVLECGVGFYQDSSLSCKPCDTTCASCQEDPGKCLSCDDPYYLLGDKCVKSCGAGLYGNTQEQVCKYCSGMCRNCADGTSGESCTACADDKYLKDDKCVEKENCANQHAQPRDMRLAGDDNNPLAGRVEVYFNNQWNTICGDGHFDLDDANVICRYLDMGRAVSALAGASPYGPGVGNILVSQLQCRGDESSLFGCRMTMNANQCSHSSDAFVVCGGPLRIQNTGRCVDECDEGFFLPSEKSECLPCHHLCRSCENEQTCTVCRENAFLTDAGVCVRDCGEGKHGKDGRCVPCQSPEQCTLCGRFFLEGTECVMNCSLERYGNTRTGRCDQCDLTKCRTCANSAGDIICSSCPKDKVLEGGECKSACSSTKKVQDSVCVESCSSGYLVEGNKCVKDCSYGYYSSGNTCNACDSSCGACADTASSCTSCKAGKFLSDGKCHDACPSGHAPEPYTTVRLVPGGEDPLQGRLEMQYKDGYAAVCDPAFTDQSASIACREMRLGNSGKVVHDESLARVSNTKNFWQTVTCKGDESSIMLCERSDWAAKPCDEFSTLGIRCSGPDETMKCGACADGFLDSEKKCQRCPYTCEKCDATGCTYTCQNGLVRYGRSCVRFCPRGFYKNGVSCSPCDTSCAACAENSKNCLQCADGKVLDEQSHACVDKCPDGTNMLKGLHKLRLTDGSKGLVEVLKAGIWRPLCGEFGWDDHDRDVVCRQLGLGSAVSNMQKQDTSPVTSPVYNVHVRCRGGESDLDSCSVDGVSGYCEAGAEATVECSGKVLPVSCVRECPAGYYSDNTECKPCSRGCQTCSSPSGTCVTCLDGFFQQGGSCVVSCAEGYYGNVGNKTCMQCTGSCKTCADGKDGAKCMTCKDGIVLDGTSCVSSCSLGKTPLTIQAKSAGTIRLRGGSTQYEGRVEVLKDGKWGMVCNDHWDLRDTTVVCRSLGFGSAVKAVPDSRYGTLGNDQLYHLDDVGCHGYEDDLLKCFSQPSIDCGGSYLKRSNAGVVCSPPPTSVTQCRPRREGQCDVTSCFPMVQCEDIMVSGKQHHTCHQCPRGFIGDGVDCIAVLSKPLSDYRRESSSTSVNAGDTITINCKAPEEVKTITPYMSTRNWLKDGKPLLPQDVVSGRIRFAAISSQLIINHASRKDSGEYACSISTTVGTIMPSTADITVRDKPDIFRVKSVRVTEGDDATLECLVKGTDTVQWSINGAAISGNTAKYRVHKQALVVMRVTVEDDGKYGCKATNNYGTDQDEAVLEVVVPAKITTAPEDQRPAEGSTVVFTCVAEGIPRPAIHWKKDGNPLPPTSRYLVTDSALNVEKVLSSDTGLFTCIVYNKYRQVEQHAKLIVRGPPTIQREPTSLSVESGADVILYCEGVGEPQPEVTWYHEGTEVTPNRNAVIRQNGWIELHNVSPEVSGKYTCEVKNELGAVKREAALTVDGVSGSRKIAYSKTPKKTYSNVGNHVIVSLIFILLLAIMASLVYLVIKKFRDIPVNQGETGDEESVGLLDRVRRRLRPGEVPPTIAYDADNDEVVMREGEGEETNTGIDNSGQTNPTTVQV